MNRVLPAVVVGKLGLSCQQRRVGTAQPCPLGGAGAEASNGNRAVWNELQSW